MECRDDYNVHMGGDCGVGTMLVVNGEAEVKRGYVVYREFFISIRYCCCRSVVVVSNVMI